MRGLFSKSVSNQLPVFSFFSISDTPHTILQMTAVYFIQEVRDVMSENEW